MNESVEVIDMSAEAALAARDERLRVCGRIDRNIDVAMHEVEMIGRTLRTALERLAATRRSLEVTAQELAADHQDLLALAPAPAPLVRIVMDHITSVANHAEQVEGAIGRALKSGDF